MATTDEKSDYVSIDGVYLHKDTLLKMAKCTGNHVIADHYLHALAYHAVIYKRQDISDEMDKIWKLYNFAPLPTTKHSTSLGKYDPDFNTMMPLEVRAKDVYKKLGKEQKKEVLRTALTALRTEEIRLFKNKSCWIGIYFVVRDRLDGTKNMKYFYEFAASFTPNDWPENLKIGPTTLSNMSRNVKPEDRNEAYYDMTDNPWDELCEKYWTLVVSDLLTKK